MNVKMDGNCPHIFIVSSESDGGIEYHVELGEYPVGKNDHGIEVFNGACGRTRDRIHGCKDFIYRCEPKLRNPENSGKIFRCKHISIARSFALDLVIPCLLRADPNISDKDQT